ncbi:IS30 family transposase [Corallococcus coralloides DSM 2259]|uniref:IS30 family transposase n=1 Tax=Corallococcus coralloides (strain ATCC 25202 / DSM 2259 / NBRC 100086 / M2) TaxID=1144275 RepID=H8MG73_CORCM|nr:IS30 family transposase [Corallococcus coralloides]AFE09135.1 IS30 family transposase [Corallococcus coralloides DSM 2259]
MPRRRQEFSAEQRAEIWKRWKAGQSMSDISRAVGRMPGTVHGVLSANGGFVPPPRRRSRLALTLEEREEISRGLASGHSMRNIAETLRRAPSTITREVARNGGAPEYRASPADSRAGQRARRPKRCLLAINSRLRRFVASKLQEDWSPEQISGALRREYPQELSMRISHETIYKSLFVQARGVLKKELLKHLRSRRTMRRSKLATTAGQQRGQIRDAVSIRERPPEVEDRAVPGHWEGDLLAGASNSHIATLVERHSRFTMLVKVAGKDSTSVVRALTRAARKLPRELRRSLTWDRGTELAKHRELAMATDFSIYFCEPQKPWQRGTNENTNRFLRQYFPDGTDVSTFTQRQLDAVARRLNQRPRKTLEFETPAAKLKQVLR